jgi:hypothetical protein
MLMIGLPLWTTPPTVLNLTSTTDSRIPQSICRAACRTPPAPLTAEAALDQAGQEVGAIMLTRNLTPVRLSLGRLTDDKR